MLYERLPNQQLQGYDDDVVRDTAPPFRVLEKCQDLCLRDRTGTNNLVRTCTSFDFQPGSRITSFGGTSEYEESLCYLTSEQAGPEGIGSLMLVPNSVHFNEICLTCECVCVLSVWVLSGYSTAGTQTNLYLCFLHLQISSQSPGARVSKSTLCVRASSAQEAQAAHQRHQGGECVIDAAWGEGPGLVSHLVLIALACSVDNRGQSLRL